VKPNVLNRAQIFGYENMLVVLRKEHEVYISVYDQQL
jgi:hypothetical protein